MTPSRLRIRTLSLCAALAVYLAPDLNAASSEPLISSAPFRGPASLVRPVKCDMRAPVICVDLAKDYCGKCRAQDARLGRP